MVFRLLKYGASRSYPVSRDIPPTPDLKPNYDVVIIGGGGHGLACAYYLSRHHGIRDVAVIEKGWLAGGNTARNTTTIRSNYITPQGIAFYKEGVALYEAMSEELDFNVMFSQRGQLTLAHTEATLRGFHQGRDGQAHGYCILKWWTPRVFRIFAASQHGSRWRARDPGRALARRRWDCAP